MKCLFCNKKGKNTNEHVWPKWLQNMALSGTNGVYIGTHMDFTGNIIKSKRIQSGESLVLGGICESCNNGWMSDLEQEVKPVFEKILIDNSKILDLSKYELNAIARWTFKTAIVINHASNYRKIVPLDHFTYFFAKKVVPNDVKIDMALLSKETDLSWIQSQYFLLLLKEEDQDIIKLHNTPRYSIVLNIFGIGLRVLWYESAKDKGYYIKSSTEDHTMRILPPDKNIKYKINNKFGSIHDFEFDSLIVE